MRCAIYGAGSLGTVLGAFMAKNEVDVTLINRNEAHVKALNEKGAHILGTVDFQAEVKAITPDRMEGTYDVLFLMTKQLQNAEVVGFLKDYLAEDGVLVTFQNGIPEPGIAAIIGSERTVGCVVEWGATMTEPGICYLTSSPDSLSFQMGSFDGAVCKEKLKRVQRLLETMCPTEISDNFLGARWSKLLINAAFSGVGTVVGGTFGDAYASNMGKNVLAACMKECIDVAHAAGVTFAKVQGKDITKLFYYENGFRRGISKALIPIAMKKHRDIVPSMLQDLQNGKACEIDAINGVVCAWGERYSVPTPVNDTIVEIVKKEQARELPLRASNLQFFKDIV